MEHQILKAHTRKWVGIQRTLDDAVNRGEYPDGHVKLAKMVNRVIKDGWGLQGGVASIEFDGILYQAMINN